MVSCLPPELWLQVFGHLDAAALSACARLSSRFLPLAQARLFAHVYLLPRRRPPATALAPRAALSVSGPPDACAKLSHLLSRSPRLARYIKRLSIVDGTLFPSFRSLAGQSLAMREKLNGAPWFLSTCPHVLHDLLQLLHLHSFDLVFPDGSKVSWSLIPRGIRRALDLLLTSPRRLHSLQLCNISFDTPATLHDFTCTLSQGSVTHLFLRNVKLFPDLPHPWAWKDTFPHTKLLDCPAKKRQARSWHAKSFSTRTHDPLLNQNHTSYLTPSALPLETLRISYDPPYRSHQDPDTLQLLSTLLSNSNSTAVLNPRTLKHLSIPSVDQETLDRVFRILDESGVSKCSLYVA